jgi:hypothetical protein
VLTHPDVMHSGIRRAFGDVHMLSHLVGAANRADIRRLAALEAENSDLVAKVERQQLRLHEAITTRDATIRKLTTPEGAKIHPCLTGKPKRLFINGNWIETVAPLTPLAWPSCARRPVCRRAWSMSSPASAKPRVRHWRPTAMSIRWRSPVRTSPARRSCRARRAASGR